MGSIIAFVLLGSIAGSLGWLVMPDRPRLGFVATCALGMLGSLLGGVLGSVISGEGLKLGTGGLLGSILGVLVALSVVEARGRFGGQGVDGGAHRA